MLGTILRTLLRFARIMVAQGITLALAKWGGIEIPMVNITVGAAISALFKFLREKFPKSAILQWLPI